MSVDRSLKAANSLTRHRNVLSRAERLKKLTEEEQWKEGESVFGLPKVAHRNLKVGKKIKKAKAEEGATEETPAGEPSSESASTSS